MVAQMMSSSLGAMGPLLSNLQTLMVSPEHQLPDPLKEEIELLKQDVETINTSLINLSRSESPNRMAMHWMNEVRDLSYDMQDYMDSMMHPNKMSDYQMNQNILSVVKKFRSLVKQASERHESYELWRWASNPSYSMVSNGQDPVLTLNGKAKQLVGIGESRDKLIKLLNTDSNDAGALGHLKVVSILGPAGVGKSTLAKEVYREIGAWFECLAFVRVSRMPDTRRLLRSIISQVQCHQRPLYGRSVQDLIDNLREHLQQKRYFIVIDDLWERTSWNIVKSAFPEDTNCSRILITTGIEKVALECCKSIRVLSSQATESEIYSNTPVRAQVGIYKVEPLSTEDSTELFFNEVFGSNHEHSNSSKEYSDEIIKMCGGLPLSIIMVANIFASQPDNAELWHHVKKYLKTSLENNFSSENMMREIVILSYNNLSHHLKTCLLHLNMYPEGCTFMKADLVKQWWAEGFVSAIAGKDINEVAECYFDELVGRGLIQPNHISFSDEVIFYTVHSTVFEIIRNKSIEENFTTVVDYSETIAKLSAKVRRLYLSFSNAKYATKPKDITLSTVRSLTFYGPVQYLPSIREFKLLRVLILEFLVDRKDIDLSGINRLFQLRYVRITTDDDNIVYLPPSMKGLKYLETLEVYARVKSVPSDIVHLPKLLHLRLQGEIKPPASVVHMKSVRTLQSFDLSSNSEDNIRQLGEMMDLQDLHLTCSTETSDLLEKNLIALASSLGKHGQLKSLVLEPGALRTSICLDCSSRVSSPPVFLQRLELLPPLCIFSRLPEWIGQLRKLCILRIVVKELTRDDVNRISGLQELTVLSLYVIQPIAESIIFSRAEFPVLKHFKLRCSILRLEFQAETMPKLRSLNLAFNAHSGEQYGDMIAGIENLLDLQGIIVQIGTAPGAEESDRMAAESVFKDAISRHSKPLSFSIRRADPVEEEIPQFSSPPVCFSSPGEKNPGSTEGSYGKHPARSNRELAGEPLKMIGVEAALASGLLNIAGKKLGSLLSSEFAAITGMKKDLSDLQDIHTEITSWLSAVHDRAIERDPFIQWVKLRNFANDIFDLIDKVYLEDEKHKIHSDREKLAIAALFAKPKMLLFRRKVAHKIKAIKVTYDAIVKQITNVNTILESFQVEQPVQSRNDKATGEQSLLSNAQVSKIPSRDHVKSEIISMLVESNNGEDDHIISIVGLGGSGKTTLARHICHDDKIKGQFKDSIFWVHVSQEFCGEKLVGKLFEAIIEEKSDLHAQQDMLRAISNKLSGKKFLLVLDDAWHEDRQDWENFMVHINNGASGSKILLTTRNQNVAKAVESKLVFNLPFLPKDESWSFFLKSSGWIEADLDSDFIMVGKDIVNKCGGVPLAIKALGSVLQEKRRINTWRTINESKLWDEENIEGRVFASLKLSFIHLKDHLKQCFTFCSIFPRGYTIRKDYLIEQWIAHGFIMWTKEEQPEDIGSDYFNSLVKGGFLQEAPETEPNEIRECWMHDLINDLAKYILQNEVVTSLPKNITMDCARQCRYLSLTSLNEDVERGFEKVHALYVAECNPSFPNLVKKSGHIRSVILDYQFDTPFPSFVLKLQYLGYLEIHNASFTKFPEAISECWNLQSLHFIRCNGFVTLPESIGKLRKLRALELKGITDLESLPQSIGEFNNLQTINLSMCWEFKALPSNSLCHMLRTLDLSSTNINMLPQWVTVTSTLECIDLHHCRELVELPKGIGNLKRLRVLNIEGCAKLRSLPSGLGQLTCLRKLGLFVVGCGGDDASISQLGNLDKLCGHLEITNLEYLNDLGDARKSYLKHMNNIQSLVLHWSFSETEEELVFDMEKELGILRALEPPPQIKVIKITGYRGHCLPPWMMKQNDSSYCEAIMLKQTGPCEFISLNELTLENCPNMKQMRGLWVLPSLKSLFLLEMANLEELWTITSDFENSKEEILRGQCCFPVLSYMEISGCPRLNVKPYFPPSLEKLYLCKSNMQLLSPGSFSQMLPPPVDESSSSYTIHSAVSHLKELALVQIMMGSSSGWELLQHHTQLETFGIYGCNELTELPESIRSLISLRDFTIYGCSTLGLLPDWLGELRSLQSLKVWDTPMIQSLPQSTKHLRSLVKLQINNWDNNLKQLPNVIQHLTSLEVLNLIGFVALTELPEWIGQLSALRELYIQKCPALECLPQSIQRLTALRSLNISGCPHLERRYKRVVGPDWHLVSHIPRVDIQGPYAGWIFV